ncbi:hypothetical protein [Hyalangium rubrum]|uniref:Uncharacterized protein n=1 Tax=Hyalangium rubrum TaxID=3103134 RepID=A0ABU5H5K5_9BACT|nr:hypothetical protein [Hyalangium sp. s54d21]MDY7228103.1 hypothetical protein [Hyalangium sp. s54d21]
MATQYVDLTDEGVKYDPPTLSPSVPPVVKPGDTVIFRVINIPATYTISWDNSSPLQNTGSFQVNGSSLTPYSNQEVSTTASAATYPFTVSPDLPVKSGGPPEYPEESGGSHGGLEVSPN